MKEDENGVLYLPVAFMRYGCDGAFIKGNRKQHPLVSKLETDKSVEASEQTRKVNL